MPVYNGEKGLSGALDSIIGQDYDNIEIIISDNGSTDSTPSICADYLRKDKRIKYYRVEDNRGGPWNFNRVFELSSGKYFMWSAHDDQRERSFVSACVEKMEKRPDAVLCQAHTASYIKGREGMLCVASIDSLENVKGLVQRYRETLKRVPITVVYGLYRASAMRKTQMFQKSIATDIAFIQELSIYGTFIQVPDVLFAYFGRKEWNTPEQDYKDFFGDKAKPWWYMPFIALFCSHWKRVNRASVPFSTKLWLWSVLIEHEISQVVLKILIKAGGRFCPGKWKERLGCAIYWRWMHSPNVKVGSETLFLDRVIKPRLGWWR